jgi:hypothetical protein
MAGIPTGNILQPGNIAVASGATRALVSQLQLLTPQFYKQYTEKYGNEDLTWWLNAFAGMEQVHNRDYFWFENRGKLMPAITLAAGGTSTAGSTVTATLSAADHFNSGTQTPLRIGETLRAAATNTEWEILTIPVTTANAFQFTLRPKQPITATLAAGDVMIFGGITDVGEASDTNVSLAHLDQRYANTITEIRDTFSATDLAEMTEVYYTGGFSGEAPGGVSQAGTSLYTLKGLHKTNTRFLNNVEQKLMKGDVLTNTGMNSSTSVGAQGFIPKILVDGETVGYSSPTLDIQKMHEITRIMDVNGCASENLWIQDIYQRQNFSDGIFKEFPAGAYQWGKNEKSEEAAVAYGVQSFQLDNYMFKVKKYKQFNTESFTGKTPTVDYFRNFGIICPQGETRDAKDVTKTYKNLTLMYQEPLKAPTHGSVGNGIRVWPWGGGSIAGTNGKMQDNVEMITYRSLRAVCANQFVVVTAV